MRYLFLFILVLLFLFIPLWGYATDSSIKLYMSEALFSAIYNDTEKAMFSVFQKQFPEEEPAFIQAQIWYIQKQMDTAEIRKRVISCFEKNNLTFSQEESKTKEIIKCAEPLINAYHDINKEMKEITTQDIFLVSMMHMYEDEIVPEIFAKEHSVKTKNAIKMALNRLHTKDIYSRLKSCIEEKQKIFDNSSENERQCFQDYANILLEKTGEILPNLTGDFF